MPTVTTTAAGTPVRQLRVRISPDDHMQIVYWAEKEGISLNDFALDAIKHYIRFKVGDYPLTTMEQQRLNQLVDAMLTLSANVANLEHVTVNGFDSLLNLTRGDNYLTDPESGELGE